MEFSTQTTLIEIGIDEAGRGPMAGPVVAAAVIWDPSIPSKDIKDSKKLSKKKRELMYEYIKENAVAYGIGSSSSQEIDKYNILQSTYTAMHRAVQQIEEKISLNDTKYKIIVDGTSFRPYYNNENELLEHFCVEKGDSKFVHIAAASILAKVEHDKFFIELCNTKNVSHYGWEKNMGYGTKQHREAIEKYGITQYHRKTFGICATKEVNFV